MFLKYFHSICVLFSILSTLGVAHCRPFLIHLCRLRKLLYDHAILRKVCGESGEIELRSVHRVAVYFQVFQEKSEKIGKSLTYKSLLGRVVNALNISANPIAPNHTHINAEACDWVFRIRPRIIAHQYRVFSEFTMLPSSNRSLDCQQLRKERRRDSHFRIFKYGHELDLICTLGNFRTPR